MKNNSLQCFSLKILDSHYLLVRRPDIEILTKLIFNDVSMKILISYSLIFSKGRVTL